VKDYNTTNIRNIVIIGHGGCGKTSFSESLLFSAGAITRLGKVEDGSTSSDYTAEEISRQISISASLLNCEYNDTKINIIDTPGFTDFIGEVKCGLKVADTAAVVLNAVEGVEVGTEIVWKSVVDSKRGSIIIINKLDHENANFDKCVESAVKRFGSDTIIAQMPVNPGASFDGIIDLIKMKVCKYTQNGDGKYTEEEIPANQKDNAAKLREQLIEKIAETDENLMNTFFENGGLTDEEIIKGLKIGISKSKIFPILCVNSTKNVGASGILDFISKYCPSPDMLSPVEVLKAGSDAKINIDINSKNEPVMFIFKTVSEKNIGEMSFYKVYSGTISSGLDLNNTSKNKAERLSQLSFINGKDRKEASQVIAGDFAGVVKLKDSHTNNTLCGKNLSVIVPPIKFPEPVITSALQPKSKGDEDKIASGLHKIHEEDPTFLFKVDPEISQTVISGQGELHLTISIKKLKDRYGVETEVIEPKIPYREAIKGKAEDVEYKHKKQSGGRGQYGHVHIKIEPLPRGTGFKFENAVVGGVVPGRFIPAVEKGVIEIMERGVIAGCKVVDVKVTLFDGTAHPVDSDEMSFKIAGIQAFKKGFKECKPILLEPIYNIEVNIPDKFMGDIMGDLTSRRGKIMGMEADGENQIVKAQVPLAEIHKYATQLRSMTQGRGFFSRHFTHYDEVPKEVMEKIVAAAAKAKEEED
jgi:elongation factor G